MPMVRADYEPFEVIATDRGRSEVLLDRRRTEQLITKPSFALRVAKALMAMRDNLDGVAQDPNQPGYRVVDLSVGFGALGLEYMMARAQLDLARRGEHAADRAGLGPRRCCATARGR